jgi:type III secretion system YscD/HrpQ family protein
MSTHNPSTWCLRFLSGALKGRTITLRPGTSTLGSAGDCEVMLPGGEVQPHHLRFHVGELIVSVQRLGEASARVNGDELAQQRKSLLAGDIVSVGNIELELDRHFTERDDPMFEWSQSVLAEDEPEPAQAAPAARSNGRTKVAAGVLVIAGLAAVAAWSSWDGPRDATVGLNMAELQKTLAPFPEVEVVAAPGGQFAVKGYVESRMRRHDLEQALQRFGPRVTLTVMAAEDMVEQARRFVSSPGVAMTYAGHGQLIVSGTADDEDVRERIRRLAQDLHPTVLVTDKVQYRPAATPKAGEAVAQWSAWQGQLPARMVSITEDDNGTRFIQLANGTRYYEGAVLRSGAELQGISVDRLTIEGGGKPPK